MAKKDKKFEELKDYTGFDFTVEKNIYDEYELSSGWCVDTATAERHIPKNGDKPEKLVVYVGLDGLYRIFELHDYVEGGKGIALETNQCFLNSKDLKEGHVTIVEPVDGDRELGLKVVDDYYISFKTGDERKEKSYVEQKNKPESTEGLQQE